MAESDKGKALDAALGQIEKQFGKGSVMRMGDNLAMNIESIPTGALSLDLAFGHRRFAAGSHRGNPAGMVGAATRRRLCRSAPDRDPTLPGSLRRRASHPLRRGDPSRGGGGPVPVPAPSVGSGS